MKFQRLSTTVMAAMGILAAQAQLAVSTDLTPEQLVQDVLAGSCVSITNVIYNGQPANVASIGGHGSFTQTGNLGLSAGVILSSGFATTIAGPEGNQSSDDIGNNGDDADLEAIMGGSVTNYSILEFDFVPTGDSVSFRYVFGSEEYPGFVCSFNDAFGFFLSGPGINGPYTNGAVNIAVLPDGVTPVTIANVNHGAYNVQDDPTCPAVNPEYFVNNTDGETICYGGFTTVLTASAGVQCGETYHIKLAVGDAGGAFGDSDVIYDSAVFLEAGSFSSEPFIPTLVPSAGVVGNVMFESCFQYTMGFVRIACDLSAPETVHLGYGGSAEMGVDIVPHMPDSLVFGPGVEVINVDFMVPIDEDGLELVELSTYTIDCEGQPTSHTFTFAIGQTDTLVVEEIVEVVACGEAVTFAPVISGGFGQYTYEWSNGGQDSSVTITPTQTEILQLTVNDLCDITASGSQQVSLSPAPNFNMSVFGSDDLREGCDNGTINFIRPQGVQGAYTINLQGGGTATSGSDYTIPGQVVIPSGVLSIQDQVIVLEDNEAEDDEMITLTATATNACAQTVTATVNLNILNVDAFVADLPNHLVECSSDSLELLPVVQGGVGPYQFLWEDASTNGSLWVPIEQDGSYALTVTDACNRVTEAQSSVTVDCEVIIPNVFSPNQDGKNDRWEIGGIGTRPNTVRLFNRWGKLVLDVKNYRNTFVANDVPDGTYFYEITVEGKGEPMTGHLTILREL